MKFAKQIQIGSRKADRFGSTSIPTKKNIHGNTEKVGQLAQHRQQRRSGSNRHGQPESPLERGSDQNRGVYRPRSFAEYTEAAVGIKQRQAYNYIQVVESLAARLIEENAAAGVTKLALLAKLNPEEREDLTGEALANITVAELKKLVEERDAMAQQLSIFQTEPEAVAEVEAEPIDPDEIRRQAEEETRQQMAAAFAEERTQLEAKHKAAMSEAVLKAEQAAAAEVRKVKADAKKQAEAETRQQVAQAREEAAKAAAAQQEAKYRAELDQAKQAEEEAQRRAETMAKQMEASSDENAVRFFMLFEQLQQKVEDMKAITETMRETSIENAEKFLNALRGALSAILANLEGGGSDVG